MNIKKSFKIVAISDVHEQWKNLVIPECDILISAGDYSYQGLPNVVKDFHEWLNEQEAGHIISVQGNHETWVEKNFEEAKRIAKKACPAVHFIDEGLVEIEGLKIWCSAITPWFHNWAWNRDRGSDIQKHWDKIPDNIDILVTHGPPYKILDEVPPYGAQVGCEQLFTRILELTKLKIHIFGHIHAGHGHKELNGVHYYNASICTEQYKPLNPVTIIEYEKAD